jgi:hypothetical protein
MRVKLESRLQRNLAAFLPGCIVKCSFAADGVVVVAIEKPATRESWWITGVARQSLIGKERLAETVEQILIEISDFSVEAPSLPTRQAGIAS